jgi:hypothetical protein
MIQYAKNYLSLVLSITISSLCSAQNVNNTFDYTERSTSQKFDEVMDDIQRYYVDPVDGKS